jgi:hypothetical protein
LPGKEKLSDYEILTDDRQMIGHCIHRLMWKYNGVNLMFSVIKLEISQTILSISSSAADNFKNSGARPDSAHLYIVLPVNSRKKTIVLPDTAQSFRGTLYIHA